MSTQCPLLYPFLFQLIYDDTIPPTHRISVRLFQSSFASTTFSNTVHTKEHRNILLWYGVQDPEPTPIVEEGRSAAPLGHQCLLHTTTVLDFNSLPVLLLPLAGLRMSPFLGPTQYNSMGVLGSQSFVSPSAH